jgi:carbon monoxide dehydrogenase subunit G
MGVQAEVLISAPPSEVWRVITDIEGSVNVIGGIESIRVISNPENGLIGLKWEETRTIFGRSATETMWITEAEENKYYKTRAEQPGVVYVSQLTLEDLGDITRLTMRFDGTPSGLGQRILSGIMSIFINSTTRKMIAQDLQDIKNAIEKE